MGYRCRWLAVRAGAPAETLAALGFAVTAELREEVYDPGLYGLAVDGWFVVIGDGWDFMDLVGRDRAAALSARGGDVLHLYTDDSAMCAELTWFAGGAPAWSIAYDGSEGIGAPKPEGDLPAAAQAVLAGARAAQDADGAEVDHQYDAIAAIGLALVGFRHDQTLTEVRSSPTLQLAVA